MNDVEEERRQCPDCGRDLPQDNFYSIRLKSGELSVRKACKQCYNKQSEQRKKKKKQRAQVGAEEILVMEEAASVDTDQVASNGHDGTVLETLREEPGVLSGELSEAVEETMVGTPDECGACGTRTGNILGDVDDRTRTQYGYLCARCYKLLNAFHANPERMRKVLLYIEITRGNRV